MVLTAIARVRAKAGREDEVVKFCRRLLLTTYPEEEGVINHIYLRQRDDPRVFVTFEQFRDRSGVEKHIKRECQILGLPPGSRVIDALRDFVEEIETHLYDVVE